MAEPDKRSVAGRLFCITRKAARRNYFETQRKLALQIHDDAPAEFLYNRLGQEYVVSVDSIADYVSLARDIGLIEEKNDLIVPFCGDRRPVWSGFESVLNEYAVNYLKEKGFDQSTSRRALDTMLHKRPPVLPTWRLLHEHLGIPIPETKFNRLLSIDGVKQEVGYVIATRRVVLPAQATI